MTYEGAESLTPRTEFISSRQGYILVAKRLGLVSQEQQISLGLVSQEQQISLGLVSQEQQISLGLVSQEQQISNFSAWSTYNGLGFIIPLFGLFVCVCLRVRACVKMYSKIGHGKLGCFSKFPHERKKSHQTLCIEDNSSCSPFF
eukprot:scpid100586/ scgid5950/ 